MARLSSTRRGALAVTWVLTFVSLLGPVAVREALADATGARIASWRIERDVQRFRLVATDNVMDVLAIKPGMTILDIGAGTGQFAYEFARRLSGTGKVYATDTNAGCIDYMRQEAGKRGLRNLHPVVVGGDGVDAFYRRERYDLITVFHVLMPYEERADYFRELRGFLAERGRLVLILYRIPAPFSRADFTGNFRALIEELSLAPAESPYYRILKDSTRKLIRDNPRGEPSEALKKAIVEDFNETLVDARFAAHFFRGSVSRKEASFTSDEAPYADWLLLPFRDSSVLNRNVKSKSSLGANMSATINKLLLVQRFRKFLRKEGLFISGFSPPVRAAFEKAGYRVDREYTELIPFEDMIVLSAR